jgi:DNA-binding NarL/FixJ family response regulator
MTVSVRSEVAQKGPVRVVVVDDHALVRQGLICLLAQVEGVEVVGEAGDGAHAIEVVAGTRPDAVLMDFSMPRMNGVEATRRIVGQWPEIRVVGLSMEKSASVKEAMLSAGAVVFLDKGADHESLVKALRAACRGVPDTDQAAVVD